MPHLDEGRLHAYLDGALHAEGPEEARAVERHVEDCADCRALLEDARQVRDEASALLGAAAPPDVSSPPPWEEVLHRAGAAAPRRRGIAWLPAGQRLAWAASLVVALGVGWWAHAALGAGPFARGFVPSRVDDASTARDLVRPTSTRAEDLAEESDSDDRALRSTSLDALEFAPTGAAGRDAPGGEEPAVPQTAAGSRALGERAEGDAFFDKDGDETQDEGDGASPRGEAAPARFRIGRADAARQADGAPEAEDAREADGGVGEDDQARLAGEPIESFERNVATPPPPAAASAEARADVRARPQVAQEAIEMEPLAGAGEPDNNGPWNLVTVKEAEVLLGATPLGVPGAETLEVAWGRGGRTLRVAQRLEGGERIELYQWAAAEPSGARVEAENTALAEVGALMSGLFGPGNARTALVEIDGLLVAASAPLSARALREALDRLEPLDRR